VTGFQEGTYSRFFATWVVRQRDAHAWVEAWIPGKGWTTYDPTPLEGRAVTQDSDAVEAWRRVEMLWDDNVIGFNYTVQVGFLIGAREVLHDVIAGASGRRWALLLAGAGAAAMPVLLLLRRRRRRRRGRRAGIAFYATAQRMLERRGWRREPGQTPLELAELAAREGGAAGGAAVELTRLYYAARFGEHPADAARVRRLLAEMAALPRRGRVAAG
jgi:hypothetical protein